MIFGEHYFFQLCRGILALLFFIFYFLMKPVIECFVYLLVPFHSLLVLLEAGWCPTLEWFS